MTARSWLARLALPVIVLLCACVSSGSGPGPAWAFAMRDVKFPMRDFHFPSGLRVIVEEDHRMPLVAVATVVGAGSTSDPAGKEGLAHYVEHLTFRAKPDGKATILSLLGTAGAGSYNAWTGFDETTYFSVGPREALPGLLLVEAGRLMTPVENIAPETAAVEKEVVRNELRVRGETGLIGAVLSATQKAVFPESHPYHRAVIGSHASLLSITQEDAKAFAKAHYRPDNTTIVIVGDVSLAEVEKTIDDSLPAEVKAAATPKPLAPRMPAKSPEPPAPPPAPALPKEQANVATPELWIGWSMPRGFDTDSVLLEAVTRAARQALPRAWLNDGDIDDVSVMRRDGAEAAMLLCRVRLRAADHPESSMDHVLSQVTQLWLLDKTGGQLVRNTKLLQATPVNTGTPINTPATAVSQPSATDQTQMESIGFQRFQRTIVTSMLADAEDLVHRASERALATHFSGEPLTYSRKLGAALSLNPSAVADFATKYLTRDRARGVLFMPIDRAAADAQAGAPPDPNAEPLPAAPDAETMKDFARPLGASDFTELTLDNGLDVIIGARRGLPVATVGLSFRTGETTVLGADRLAKALMFEHVTTKIEPGQFGARYWREGKKDEYRYFMAGSGGNVNEMVALLAEYVSGMDVTSERADRYKRDVLGAVQAWESWAEVKADRAFWSALYPGHFYGKTSIAADLLKLSDSEADDWIKATHTANNATLVIVGEIDPQAVSKTVKDHFSGLAAGQPRSAPAALPLPKGPPAKPAFTAIPRTGATQVEVSFACRLPEARFSIAAHRLAATLLDARLTDRLRRKLGASYGFHVGLTALAGGSAHLRGSGAIDNPHAAEAMIALKEELTALVTAPLAAGEMDRARWARVLEYAVSYQSTEDVVDAVLSARSVGLPKTSIDKYASDLLTVSPESVVDLLKTCAAGPVIVTVGDQETSEHAFAAAWP